MSMGSPSEREIASLLLMKVREITLPKGADPREKCAFGFKPLIEDMIGGSAMSVL